VEVKETVASNLGLEVKRHLHMDGERMLKSPHPGPEDRAYEGSK
jgi:hypothetical protein